MRRGDLWVVPFVSIMLATPVVAAQVIIDMPPPPAKNAPGETSAEAEVSGPPGTTGADVDSAEPEVSAGEIALARYRYARIGASDVYASLPLYRGYYGRGFHGRSWYWDSCWRHPFGGSLSVWRGFRFSWSGSTFRSRGAGDAGGGG
ncbi:MAG: hypothetical protein SYC29_13235 [Planctomycetota bacterium]|nr:hypothetical protein [Planctomycetota bacterium]